MLNAERLALQPTFNFMEKRKMHRKHGSTWQKSAKTVWAMAIAAGFAIQQPAAQARPAKPTNDKAQTLLIKADLLFDGKQFLPGQAVLVKNGKIAQVAPAGQINAGNARVLEVPGGTILPGFIDMHTHHLINNVPPRRMLELGVTTARDLGSAEPLTLAITDQPYQLRQFLSGPILQAPNGYPNVVFPGSGAEISGAKQAQAKVDELASQGASVIAVSLEEGGEFGAPWNWHEPSAAPPWNTLSDAELNAIVKRAHDKGLRVTAYLGNDANAQRALAAGVDEWAHSPCDTLSDTVINHPKIAGLAIDGTLDTEVKCNGALDNAAALVGKGAKLFYSTDMGHPDIPHGIDAQEIHMGLHIGFHNGKDYEAALTQALASATSQAGEYLGLAPLGQIVSGAPADLIVIGSDVHANFKELEYPRVVIKDGLVVIERAQGE